VFPALLAEDHKWHVCTSCSVVFLLRVAEGGEFSRSKWRKSAAGRQRNCEDYRVVDNHTDILCCGEKRDRVVDNHSDLLEGSIWEKVAEVSKLEPKWRTEQR
jgi:hypothetical protein